MAVDKVKTEHRSKWIHYKYQPLPSSPSSGTVATTGSASSVACTAGSVSGSAETALSVSVFWGSLPSTFFAAS
jgi:hypothetical protein